MTSTSLAQPPMEETKPAQGLTPRVSTDGQIIRSPKEFVAELEKWQKANYHVLSPFANFSALPPHWGILPTKVTIDPNPDAGGPGEVYQDGVFTRGNDVAIAKLGLAKIAMAAGMTIKTERTDPRTIPNFWEVRATARFIGINGTPQERDATEEWDLRDGSERAKQAGSGKQVTQNRIKGLRQCESRACNAAVRAYGVKQKYTKAELAKPFVVIQMIYLPNMTDPAEKQQVAERALGGSSLMYGSTRPAALSAAVPELLDIIGAGDGKPIIDVQPADAKADTVPVGRLIEKVEADPEAGLHEITLDGGEAVVTFAPEVVAAAVNAHAAGLRVQLTMGEQHGQAAVTAIAEVKDAPSARSVETLPEGAVRLSKVDTFTGTSKRTNRPFTKYTIVSVDGEQWSTFSDTFAKDAQHAIDHGWPVRIADKINPQYPDQRDLTALTPIDPKQPTLPGAAGDKY